VITCLSIEDKMCNNNNQTTLWRESLNSDGHHFPLSLVEREKTWLPHMTLEIQVLTWDRHKHVLMCYFPNFWLITLIIVNYSTCGISYFFMQYGSLDTIQYNIENKFKCPITIFRNNYGGVKPVIVIPTLPSWYLDLERMYSQHRKWLPRWCSI
jgi:hypothetical protein